MEPKLDQEPTYKILCIDDEPPILRALHRELQILHCPIVTLANSTEAFEMVQTQEFALVISDFLMPNYSGKDILSMVQQTFPLTRRVLLTGRLDYKELNMHQNKDLYQKIIEKPWERVNLITALQRELSAYTMALKG